MILLPRSKTRRQIWNRQQKLDLTSQNAGGGFVLFLIRNAASVALYQDLRFMLPLNQEAQTPDCSAQGSDFTTIANKKYFCFCELSFPNTSSPHLSQNYLTALKVWIKPQGGSFPRILKYLFTKKDGASQKCLSEMGLSPIYRYGYRGKK